MQSFSQTGRTEYGPGTSQLSPLGAVIPHGPTAIVPVFDDDVPSLLIIITSSDKLARFDDGDARFAQNVGSVLASAMLRERALAAGALPLLPVAHPRELGTDPSSSRSGQACLRLADLARASHTSAWCHIAT